jgi:hypothetical protein
MVWAFVLNNWQELGFFWASVYFQWRYWKWYYVGRKEPDGVRNLNR